MKGIMCKPKELGGKRCDQASKFHTAKASLKHKIRRQLREGKEEEASSNQKVLDRFVQAQEKYGDHITVMHIPLDAPTQNLMNNLYKDGLDPIIIGGSVRDVISGASPKDIDVEVYGDTIDNIAVKLRKQGYQVDEVGKSFGVLKIGQSNGLDVDLSVPRRDSLNGGAGHRGFDVDMDTALTLEEASTRRDFTINAMGYSPKYGVAIDPHGGLNDLKDSKLRHVSEAFAEDPLRVLRGFQFGSRYGMTMHPDTVELSKKLLPKAAELSQERRVIEWEKFYAKGNHPENGLKVLRETGWDSTVPHLQAYNTPSTALTVKKAIDATVKNKLPSEKRVELASASLAAHMSEDEGKDFIRATVHGKDHQRAAISLAVKYETDTDSKLRSLARQLDTTKTSLAEYALVRESHGDDMTAMRANAKRLRVLDACRQPLVMGRDALALSSRQPGVWVGLLNKDALEAQDDGVFATRKDAMKWLKKTMKERSLL